MNAILLGIAATGPLLLISAPCYLASRLRSHARSAEATGVVVGSAWEKMREPGTPDTYRLTVRYQRADGTAETFSEGGLRRCPADGTTVPLRYDPRRPGHATLKLGTRYYWQMAALMVVAGACLTGALVWHNLAG